MPTYPLVQRFPVHDCKVNDWLIQHASNVTSQGGEDGIIAYIFQHILKKNCSPDRSTRWCVEFGAWDGKHLSNTWNLCRNDTWHGVLIEADVERFQQLKELYQDRGEQVTCLNRCIAFDGPHALEKVLTDCAPQLPHDFELISIDIDGADYHVWDSMLVYRPQVVVIEFNPTIPNNVVYIQDRNMNVFQGSSLLAIVQLAQRKGYELVSTTTFNAFFVRKEFYPLFHIPDNALHLMHNVSMPTEFFQLYDGTIKLTGCKKLIWKKIPIDEAKFQVLSKKERRFPCSPMEIEATKNAAMNDRNNPTTLNSAGLHSNLIDWKESFLEGKRRWKEGFTTLQCILASFKKALDDATAAGPVDREECMHQIISTYLEWAESLLSSHQPDRSIPWFKQVLYIADVEEIPVDLRLKAMSRLGEAYIRVQKFEKARFWLGQVLLEDATHAMALKSMAKLLTKWTDENQVHSKRLDGILNRLGSTQDKKKAS